MTFIPRSVGGFGGSTLRCGVRFGLRPPGTRLDVLDGCTNRGNWVPVLVNFAVEPRFAGSGSSHQFFFFAMTEFYQTQGAGPAEVYRPRSTCVVGCTNEERMKLAGNNIIHHQHHQSTVGTKTQPSVPPRSDTIF